MSNKSRLIKKNEKKSKQNLILSAIGIIVVFFILIRYGIPLLSDTSFFVGQLGKKSQSSKNVVNKSEFIAPPNLNPIPQITKEQTITISGNTTSNSKVEIYLNGTKENEITSDEEGFFELDLELSEGENIIKARGLLEDKKSDFSNQLIIRYQKKEPNLTINSPNNGDNITGGNQITISGTTDSQNNVTVNGFFAVIDSGGNWSYQLTLISGNNEIKIISTDAAGNKTEKYINVNYSP